MHTNTLVAMGTNTDLLPLSSLGSSPESPVLPWRVSWRWRVPPPFLLNDDLSWTVHHGGKDRIFLVLSPVPIDSWGRLQVWGLCGNFQWNCWSSVVNSRGKHSKQFLLAPLSKVHSTSLFTNIRRGRGGRVFKSKEHGGGGPLINQQGTTEDQMNLNKSRQLQTKGTGLICWVTGKEPIHFWVQLFRWAGRK